MDEDEEETLFRFDGEESGERLLVASYLADGGDPVTARTEAEAIDKVRPLHYEIRGIWLF